MPNKDSISNILEMEDLIITNVESDSKEIHIYFKLERKEHVCPDCGAVTNKVHDYRLSIIKDAPIMGKKTFLHYSKPVIIVTVVISISRKPSTICHTIAG